MRLVPLRSRAVPGLILALLLPIAAPLPLASRNEKDRPTSADDFLVVDCLLPGKVRRLGRKQTYLTRRQPVRTTALDCRIRGGEYTSHDRASYATALSVWLGEARGGSAEAEYYVGQIFEKGLGTEPDFAGAAVWYEKAAEKGHSGAQTALGFLYETGLGVERDPERALYWYRQAAGLADELVVLDKGEHEELLGLLRDREREVDELETRVRELQERLEAARRSGEAAAEESRELETLVAGLRSDLEARRREVAELEAQLDAAPVAEELAQQAAAIDFGSYHALVIGNSRHAALPEIPRAGEEAQALAALLGERYGFRVRLLLDASRYQILEALNQLREQLTEKDNLVVFYAGHSREDVEGRQGWWQPVDATSDNRANWISDRVLSDHLEVLTAKQVLLLADAAFPAILTRSSIPDLPRGMTPDRRREVLQEMATRRSRLVLASGRGEVEPETEGSGFTRALLRELTANDDVLGASSLYRRLSLDVSGREGIQFAPIRWSRHEGGADFFFVPRGG